MIGMTISFRWPCTYLQNSVPDQKVRRRWYACFRFESFKMYYVAPLTNSGHNFDDTISKTRAPLPEECVDDPVSEWVDGELRDAEEVLPGEVPLLLLVQRREPRPQPLDLTRSD